MRHAMHSGIRGLAVLALISAGCAAQRAPSATTGSTLTSATIGPAGGTLAVTAGDSATLAGTSITFPAGALAAAVTITINPSSQPVAQAGDLAAGPVVDFGPDGTVFLAPVTITLPVAIPSGSVAANLSVEAVEGTGAARLIQVDSQAAGFATFHTGTFTRFGGVIHDQLLDGGPAVDAGPGVCASNSDCACGECANGQCQGVTCSCPAIPSGSCTVAGPGPCCCPTVVACDGGGATCASNADCAGDAYCQSSACGGSGTCAARPQTCPQTCAVPELCGCDGQSYCNSCIAAGAGVNVSSNGSQCGAQDGG